MGAARAMAKSYPERVPPRDPHAGIGVCGGGEQQELNLPEVPRKINEHIKGVYQALQLAVEKFGGVVAFAVAIGKGHGETGRRIRRAEDDHGDTQRAFIDYVAVIGTDPKAREVFLYALCDFWGYKQPDFKNAPSPEEQLRSLLSSLDGETGDAIKERAARLGGFHPRSFGK
jgi:hypothetical protein